jgi:chromosome segregation ATPase
VRTDHEGQVKERDDALQARQEALTEGEAQTIALRGEVEALSSSLEDARRDSDAMRARLESAEGDAGRVQGDLEEALEAKRGLERKVDALMGERNATSAALDAARDDVVAMRRERDEISSERDGLASQLSAEGKALSASLSRIGGLESSLSRTQVCDRNPGLEIQSLGWRVEG